MFKRPQADILALIIATVAEFTGLFFWLQCVDAGQRVAGIAIVVAGLLAERVAVYISIRAVYGDHPPHKRIAMNLILAGFGESVAWLLWLFFADTFNREVATLFLALLILVEHSIQLGYFRRAKALAYVLDPKTIVFSMLEGVVAYFWLYFVRSDHVLIGAAVLFFGLGIEHVIQGSLLGLEEDKDKKLA